MAFSNKDPSSRFYGRGLDVPFRRGPSDFVSVSGVDKVRANVKQVLATRSGSRFTQGELPWRSEFGSLINIIRHRNNDEVTAELARVYIAEALDRWVPQVRLRDVEVDKKKGPKGEESLLQITIRFDVLVSRGSDQTLATNLSEAVSLSE